MMIALREFFDMGGYGFYIWSAYGCVFFFLLTQWFFPFKRWRQYCRKRHE